MFTFLIAAVALWTAVLDHHLGDGNPNMAISSWPRNVRLLVNTLPLALVLVASVLLWRRLLWGWVGVTGYYGCALHHPVYQLFQVQIPRYTRHGGYLDTLIEGLTHSLIAPVIWITTAIVVIPLALLFLPGVRRGLAVDRTTAWTTLAIGMLLGVIWYYLRVVHLPIG